MLISFFIEGVIIAYFSCVQIFRIFMVKILLNGNRVTVFGLFSDHGIKACDLDGEKDQCIPCPPGWGQKNNVSSLNMEEAECYTTKHTENCAIGLFTKGWNFFITSTGKKCYTFMSRDMTKPTK